MIWLGWEEESWRRKDVDMGVSENSGFSPQIIHFNRVFHYKPSILGYPYFRKHPYIYQKLLYTIDVFIYVYTHNIYIISADMQNAEV